MGTWQQEKKIELLGKKELIWKINIFFLTATTAFFMPWWREKQMNPSVGNNYFELPSMDSLGNFVVPLISIKRKPFHTYLKI